ncbi:MAG: hypothetical protein K9L68_02510 [Spirochaetales bacterium]|nr:hypothetical protein [Spirochaetales bacterium]MCF7937449.1 hypothetical protein [Spirochaetales bacterium]
METRNNPLLQTFQAAFLRTSHGAILLALIPLLSGFLCFASCVGMIQPKSFGPLPANSRTFPSGHTVQIGSIRVHAEKSGMVYRLCLDTASKTLLQKQPAERESKESTPRSTLDIVLNVSSTSRNYLPQTSVALTLILKKDDGSVRHRISLVDKTDQSPLSCRYIFLLLKRGIESLSPEARR